MSKQAMEMALEALNQYVGVVESVNDPESFDIKVNDAGKPARDAISALKEAIKQHDAEPVGEVSGNRVVWSTKVIPADGSKLYLSAPSIPEGWHKNVIVAKVIDSDWPDAHQVMLKVGVQSFDIGMHHETKAESEWYADMFIKALASAISASPQPTKGDA